MAGQRIRKSLIVIAFGAVFVMAPNRSEAGWFDWLWGGPCCTSNCSAKCSSSRGLWPWTAGSYRPTYRTSWARVPVTRYSQTVVVDPATGSQTVALQPCNTFTWQARRVPTHSVLARPVYWSPSHRSSSFGCAEMPTCGNAVTASPVESAPYYAPPTRQQLTPGNLPGSSEPANTRPQLDPDQLRVIPQGSAIRWTEPNMRFAWQVTTDKGPAATRPRLTPSLVPPIRHDRGIDQHDRMRDVPPLLDPRQTDRSASRLRTVIPTSWPALQQRDAPGAETPARSNGVWDDTGWETERRW